LRQIGHARFLRVAEVDRAGDVVRAVEQRQQPGDEIIDMSEAAGLGTVAMDQQRFDAQCRDDEVADHPAIVDRHARAIGVEDAHDDAGDAVLAGKPLAPLARARQPGKSWVEVRA
jgi:hypothetical protein